jgi:hypothetical protein
MAASVELPSGLDVSSLTLYYEDPNASPDVDVTLYLRRCDMAGTCTNMASADSSAGGVGSDTDATISNPTVDNEHYAYVLLAAMDASDIVLRGAGIDCLSPTLAMGSALAPRLPPPASDGLAEQAGANVDPTLAGGQALLEGHALHTSGTVAQLTEPPLAVHSEGSYPLGGGGGSLLWQRHTVGGCSFHPHNSGPSTTCIGAGGRYVSTGSTYLLAPLNLISGKTIRYARFTYSDLSPSENPNLYLYRVDRQGGGSYVWTHTPDAVGGTFVATSPPLDLLVDNANYAYYFMARLGTSAVGTDLKAMEIEISYALDVYLPVVLREY